MYAQRLIDAGWVKGPRLWTGVSGVMLEVDTDDVLDVEWAILYDEKLEEIVRGPRSEPVP